MQRREVTTTQNVPVYFPQRKKKRRKRARTQEVRTEMPKDAKELIAERVNEMPMDAGMEYKYVCMDTGMYFETYDEGAAFSPYTGTANIEAVSDEGAVEPEFEPSYSGMPGYYEQEQQTQDKGLPAGQGDQKKQKPLKPNPAPGQSNPLGGMKQLKQNPSGAKSGSPLGKTSADNKGFTK